MARQLQSTYTGTIGNLTFYKLYNGFYVRSKSSGGTQTEATKAGQKPFAAAVTIAAYLRKIAHPAIPYPASKDMQHRLIKATLQWLRATPAATAAAPWPIPQLEGFQFLPLTPLSQKIAWEIAVVPSVNKGVTITLPAFIPKQTITAPAGTKKAELCFAWGTYSLREKKILSLSSQSVQIPYTARERKEQKLLIPVATSKNVISIIAVSISYKVRGPGNPALITIQQKAHKAAAILYAIYGGA